MPFACLARLFSLSFLRRRHRRDGATLRRQQRRRLSKRVQAISAVVQVPEMQAMSVEFDMRSNRSMSPSFYLTRTDRLGRDPVDVAKSEQQKLRKALERAVKQERKEARTREKLAEKSDRAFRTRGSSGSRIAVLAAGTVSDCSFTSDQEILAEIWAKRPSSVDRLSVENMPEVDDELVDTAPMEFLFFTGCPDDRNLRDCRLRSNTRAAR
ncbi:hypothetical protein PHYPSEUDO_013766 [Phytophthora pseudosyringae]|uniref:Uncharacterized protein n=1 Tax=Phytophthora pseudosyringae TaxID=221518 RepID=A0A8T1V5V8_9STRA|nr:hypothetical protein PHYPSEUDO_013766 [Phytophthora pseudosyringae]